MKCTKCDYENIEEDSSYKKNPFFTGPIFSRNLDDVYNQEKCGARSYGCPKCKNVFLVYDIEDES